MEKSRVNEKKRFTSSNYNDVDLFLFIEEQIRKVECDWKVMSSLNKNKISTHKNTTHLDNKEYNLKDNLDGRMMTSFIPGHHIMDKFTIYSSELIAFFIDIRDSSTHFKK
ncbi:hypothetical protein ACTVKO_04025 [Serratia nevei]|uniref:hypothetical protein n=1 Tax=Serratia nevei TaxID=2703794 RepID=UPI003FA7507E